ncbi:hypothetical protein PKB_0845 [Pseudomonas knackmussii B13]|uniref:Uncharacterized protein n=1 Tax=Pseudomonas knackmussii (strain DSM 6978 / CCUG 54928 / LMG 23759 / B13) TaxID=1301098 RepID=A0A024HCL3_PSEKB|nr:hypothetical protein [Pseudomonas knackmussii]CDF82213.1 hypothetical protein PKB_0845 [Pseudomonas knackmussii B13]
MKMAALLVLVGIPMFLEAISTYNFCQKARGRPVRRFFSWMERLAIALSALLMALILYTML